MKDLIERLMAGAADDDLDDVTRKTMREAATALQSSGGEVVLDRIRAEVPDRVESSSLGDYDAEQLSIFDNGYNACLTRVHNILNMASGALGNGGNALPRCVSFGARSDAASPAQPSGFGEVCIVCDWKDADPFPRFIEAEVGGRSVRFDWRDREDGLKELVIPTQGETK